MPIEDERNVGRLTLVATPIGNLGDITLRALDALRDADAVFAEDTRVTGKLLHALGVDRSSAKKPQVQRLDENTLSARTSAVLDLIAAGEHVAYCTDAGMPGVSDPGLRLVAAAREAGLPVEVLPGASAAATAYVASGTTATSHYFGGFFPRKTSEQKAILRQLRNLDAALIFYESPHRLLSALEVIGEEYPHREIAVCRELTKMHEEVARGNAADLVERFEGGVKGEIVLVIDPPNCAERELDAARDAEAAIESAIRMARDGAAQKHIVAALMADFGISKNEAYKMALDARAQAAIDNS